MKYLQVLAAACALAGVSSAFAGTIDFENVPPQFWAAGTSFNGSTGGGQDLGSFYQGVTFGADAQIVRTSPVFPAHSGNFELENVNLANPSITINFSAPQTDVSFWYTTELGFTAQAFDKNGNLLGSANGNLNVTFNPPAGTDSFLDLNFANISKVVITDGAGTFTTIDDLSASGISGLPVPDATGTFGLLGVAGLGLVALRRKLAVQ